MWSEQEKAELNRRGFLHSAAAVGAGLAFSRGGLAQSEGGGATDDINVALLGAGSQGQVLLDACRRIPGIRFKAVCDIWAAFNRERVSRKLKAYRHEHNTYADYREMLGKEEDLDAVIVATPDFWHAPHTVACLEAGLHVYCETAMSNTIEGAAKMVEAARRTGKLLQIGSQRRSNPRYLHCYEKLMKKRRVFGRIAAASAQWNRMVTGPVGWPQRAALGRAKLRKYGYASMAQFRNWRWYRGLGGGPVVDLGSHQIDAFNWFLGASPSAVMASGRTGHLDKKTHEWYDTVMAVYEYETAQGPASAYYQILSSNRNGGYFEEFMGGRGTLVISQNPGREVIYPELTTLDRGVWARCVEDGLLTDPNKIIPDMQRTIPDVRETPRPPEYYHFGLPVRTHKPHHQPHLENFFDAIRGRAELNCPAEVGYETTVAVLKINEAIDAERKLKFQPGEFKV